MLGGPEERSWTAGLVFWSFPPLSPSTKVYYPGTFGVPDYTRVPGTFVYPGMYSDDSLLSLDR